MTATCAYSRLVRFVPTDTQSNSTTPLIGEPVDTELDVGQATYSSQPVRVHVYSGTSILHPGERTGEEVTVGRLLSPLAASEVGMIRCIGLNYITHAKEVGMEIPTVPTLFTKPDTALAGPWPQKTVIPKSFVQDDAADYEAEVVIVIGKDCKNVSEQNAMDHLLGITAANDVSSRKAQFSQSQWSYSKGFDGACPIGPAFVHKDAIANMTAVQISASLDGKVVQKSDLSDLIFSIPKIISFLSQGTTLRAGTIILTGTPAGIGWTSQPKRTLQHGSTFAVTISHGVGTLINQIEHES